MKKKTAPKKPSKFPVFLVLFLVLGYLFSAGNTSDSSYDRAMKSQLNRETATGAKIVTYHLEDERTPGPADATSNALLAEALKEILDTLTDREADVLRMRFGMYDGRTHTLEEVGQIFGVTRERIRQIENKAIRKLRHPSRAKKIKDFYC